MTERSRFTSLTASPTEKRRSFRLQVQAMLAGWGLLCLAAVAVLVWQSVWNNERAFEAAAARLANQVTDRALIAETALEGFAAFVMSRTELNHAAASEYARTLLERYPFLYMFEVATRIDHAERARLERRMAAVYPGFSIRRFDYEQGRQWRVAPDAAAYYPIIFQEPHFTDEREIVGLDLYSSDLLMTAMRESFLLGIPMATRPFTLAENVVGYVIHRALDRAPGALIEPLTATRYALLALSAERLFGDLPGRHPGLAVRLLQTPTDAADPSSPALIYSVGKAASPLERLTLPAFEQSLSLASAVPSQPFELTSTWQMTWRDLNLPLLFGLLVLALAAPLLARHFAVAYFENRIAGLDSEGVLYQMANYDSLTGVANRHRLLEELELTLLRAQRDRRGFCLLFVDIDAFRQINERLGHAAGDAVLVEFCHRVSGLLRADETIGRLGGDEFVLVISDTASAIDIPALSQRLRDEVSRPMHYRKEQIPLRISIGHACFPTDGRNVNALLNAADRRMYRDKQDHGSA